MDRQFRRPSSSPAFGSISNRVQSDLLAFFLYTAITLLMTWPLVTQMDRVVIGWVGDNFYFVWLIGWFQKQLLALQLATMAVPTLNYPEGWQLAYNEITPATTFFFVPVSLLGGPTLAYNASLLFTFVLSGLGVFWWVRKLTGSVGAALIAGAIFAFAPYRMSHLMGHLNLMGTQWFPFYFMGLHSILDHRRISWATIASTAILLGLIGFTSQYYLYMTLLLSLVYVPAYLLLIKDAPLSQRLASWKALILLLLASLPLVLLSLAPYLQLASQGNLLGHTFDEVRVWSASLTDFVLPSPRHFLWGEWVDQHFSRAMWVENTLYVGVVATVLAILAIVKGSQLLLQRGIVAFFTVMALVAFILALGTDLHWLGNSVIVKVPEFLQSFHPYAETFIPLPGYFLFKYFPFYGVMRVWMRFGIFVNLFVTLLAGIGAAWLLQRINPLRRGLVIIALLFLVIVDFYPRNPWLSTVQGRAVDHWLAEQSSPGAVVQFPFWEATTPEQTYYTLIHQKPFVGGFFAAFNTPQFERIQPILKDFPTKEGVALLHELGVRWVVINASRYPNWPEVEATLSQLGLHLAVELDNDYVYIMP